ncbi:MAG: hypothetical protein HYR88_17950 [Verrucomicrobia bacterium]|nr:hypothetical protein [Verrucomicrobiota bacterium]MBI3868813.1 hypothetical protein [Verrucomicrobiota bacterium]
MAPQLSSREALKRGILAVMRSHKEGGPNQTDACTVSQICYWLGADRKYVSPRVSELERDGRIVKVGLVGNGRRGRPEGLYRLADGL